MKKITVIGGGAFGTSLAMTAAKANNDVILWAREQDVVQEINESHTNRFLPKATLPDNIIATNDMQEALSSPDIVLFVTPAQYVRDTFKEILPKLNSKTPVVICAKGIEVKTGLLLSEVIKEISKDTPLAVLSGPGFAAEIADEKITAVTIGADNINVAEEVSNALKNSYFRPYISNDLITPQIGGSVKNVIAIAVGIADGYELGDNGRSALIARGLAEMSRFAAAIGGKKENIIGLSGVGDLILTANSKQSRNYSCGYEIGKTANAESVISSSTKTVEGLCTVVAVLKRAKDLGVEMPICQAIYNVVYEGKDIETEIEALFSRSVGKEF
ncbi:MAG: NAD(P)-dependent glycerol-3-phosphate dehydrogenase [Alphaproteobacteria bacterium]|jgi:glycerol-3-phosphate dehydrogenase (NAD(P)+)|nr:NAD(P)-dependent glycerol-3-phosphate dehydrogenase [Alphaproteobacteria bacterium]